MTFMLFLKAVSAYLTKTQDDRCYNRNSKLTRAKHVASMWNIHHSGKKSMMMSSRSSKLW